MAATQNSGQPPISTIEARASVVPETGKLPADVVLSTRLPSHLADWVISEANQRHVDPSGFLRDLVAAAKDVSKPDRPFTVSRADLHRLIDQLSARSYEEGGST